MSADFRANLRERRHLRELAGRAHQDGTGNPKPVFLPARLLPERTARGHVGSSRDIKLQQSCSQSSQRNAIELDRLGLESFLGVPTDMSRKKLVRVRATGRPTTRLKLKLKLLSSKRNITSAGDQIEAAAETATESANG